MVKTEKVGKNTETAPRKFKRGSGRERVLDAYAAILREEGASAATLDEVARRAEISKGGLLHHFGSKEMLTAGLLERMIQENRQDIEFTMANPGDPVTAYLTACMNADDAYSQTYLAVMKLAGSLEPVDEALNEVLKEWQRALTAALGDPVLARMIQLLGDGLYSHALLQGTLQELDPQVVALARELIAGQ